MRSFMICTPHQILLYLWIEGGQDEQHKWLKKRNAYRFLMRKPERKRPYGRPRLRWENNIQMHIKKNMVEVCVLDSCGPGQGQVFSS
jgi:hypothetical protein